MFRDDRIGRSAGGVVIYARQSMAAIRCGRSPSPIRTSKYCVSRSSRVVTSCTFVCALYHPPSPIYDTAELLDLVENTVHRMHQVYPDSHIILAGDLNTLSDNELVIRTSMTSIVMQPADEGKQLAYSTASTCQTLGTAAQVVKSAVKSDHLAIFAHTGVVKATIGKTRCVYR